MAVAAKGENMPMEMTFLPGRVLEVVGSLSDFILSYALALAATSVLAVALLEVWKSVWKTRERFHMRQLHKWISQAQVPGSLTVEGSSGGGGFHDEVYRQIVLLTTGQHLDRRYTMEMIRGDRFELMPSSALFALELERMLGQIQEAADVVLANPTVYQALYLFLTHGAGEGDISKWFAESTEVPEADPGSRQDIKERVDAFSRLSKFVKRRIDSLQITMSYQWARWNQTTAVVLGAALLFASLAYIEISSSGWAQVNPLTWLRIAVASLVGGIVAPVAKDLVTALKKVRQNG
jgi:hypothetical protein